MVKFFKISNNDAQFLLSCSKPRMCAVSVGYPYATTYHMQGVATDLEAQILFGKQKRQVAYTFVHPDLEFFAKEQGVIMSDWINGDTTILHKERLVEWAQQVIGTGKVFAIHRKGKTQRWAYIESKQGAFFKRCPDSSMLHKKEYQSGS